MSEIATRTGGCHCGKVRFEASVDLGEPVTACNCSMCGRSGTLLSFVAASHFTLLAGEEELTEYRFNKQHIAHLFCRTCGIRSFSRGTAPDGSTMVAVNVRCLDDVDLDALEVTHFDGKSL